MRLSFSSSASISIPLVKEIFNSCHESCVLGSWTFLKCVHCKQYFSSNAHTRTHCLTLTLPLTTCAVTYLSLAHITNWQKVFLKKSLANLRMAFSFYECFIQHPSPSQTNRVLNFFSCWSTHFLCLSPPHPPLSLSLPTWQWMQMLSNNLLF